MARGRPPKYDEELIPRHFALPESLNSELVGACRKAGVDQVKFVRQAIRNSLSGGVDKAFPDPAETLSIPTEVRLALVDAIREEKQKDTFAVRLPEPDRERVKELADAIGYSEPQQLIEDVMKNLLRRPEEIQEMLLGRAMREIQAALLAEGKADIAKGGTLAKKRLTEKVQAIKDDATKTATKSTTTRKKKIA